MSRIPLKVARGILLRGGTDPAEPLHKATLLEDVALHEDGGFRKSARELGAVTSRPGLRFFDTSVEGKISFGPGAGLVVGISLGTESLRAAIVDANGWRYHEVPGDYEAGQLGTRPAVILNRMRDVAREVISKALLDERLTVDGTLPLLGYAVAWPSPLNRHREPVGLALTQAGWRRSLDGRDVREHFGVRKVYALNDTHAAAIAVAHRQTHSDGYLTWDHPKLALVLRLGGGIGGAIIVIEHAKNIDSELQSGFGRSILLGGVDNHAGEIGHAPFERAFIDELNKTPRPGRLRPLEPVRCSCSEKGSKIPDHVETYASAKALSARFSRSQHMHEVLGRVLADQGKQEHQHALQDTGAVIGKALLHALPILNPASITLTGALAVPVVEREVAARIKDQHPFGDTPEVISLPEPENAYVRVTGAALALIRNDVHRRLDWLLGPQTALCRQRIMGLTEKIKSSH